MSTRLPIYPQPETTVTARVPRTRKYYLGERRGMTFKVPEQRGIDTEWTCSKVEVYAPDGSKHEYTSDSANFAELSDGTFIAYIDLIVAGMWTIIFYYGPEDESESFQYRMRARVVA